MKAYAIPATCCLVLTALLSAGISHWWSVRQFTGLIENGLPIATAPAALPEPPPSSVNSLASRSSKAPAAQALATNGTKGEQDFFEALVEKMNRVEAQNRDLLDQLAETNRDMMKLEFRVDTHSESFRPMPLVEEKPFSSLDQNPGVLPPRAEPVRLPSHE